MKSARRNAALSILFTLFGGPGIALFFTPLLMTRFRLPSAEPFWQIALAAAIILVGLIPLIESVARFVRVGKGTLVPGVPTEHLVVSGLYRYLRNPMYSGIIAALLGETMLFQSGRLAVLTICLAAGFNFFVQIYEEPTLLKRHPAEYAEYKRNVPRWIPRPRPWNAPWS